MNRDLTKGNSTRVLINFTLPLFISVIFQQLYNIADSVIAGKYAGDKALAAVGASYPITMIFMAVAIGCQVGCSVVISKYFGSGDFRKTRTCITTSLIAGAVLSSVLCAAGVALGTPLMALVNTPPDIFEAGKLYLQIYTGGFVFLFLYNVATGVFNSLGDSKTPLFLLIGSSITNVFLDALFVISFDMGVSGVAWATFIAQGAACILALFLLRLRVKSFAPRSGAPLFSKRALREILYVAVPSVLQQSFVSVGNMFIQYLVNGFGYSVIAGYSAAIKLNTFAITNFTTLSSAISTFTAQNMGAGREERVKEGFRTGIVCALCAAALFCTLFALFGERLMALFMNAQSSKTVLDTGREFLRIVSPFYFSVCLKLVCDGVLRGAQRVNHFMATTFTDLVLRVVLAFIFAPLWGAAGIWAAWPISWIVSTVMSVIFYRSGVWRNTTRSC